jgi:hypothetical protein
METTPKGVRKHPRHYRNRNIRLSWKPHRRGSGNIPVIQGIECLDCSRNQLSGNIPVIPGIKWLDCSDNNLSGNIPVIPGIEELYCSHNHTEGGLEPHQRCLILQNSTVHETIVRNQTTLTFQ